VDGNDPAGSSHCACCNCAPSRHTAFLVCSFQRQSGSPAPSCTPPTQRFGGTSDQDARQAPSSGEGKDSADSEAFVNVNSASSAALCVLAHDADGRSAAGGREIAGDQSTPFQWRLRMSGRCWRCKRLETPLRLFTSEEMATLGGYSTSRCTGSSSNPSSIRVGSSSVGNWITSCSGTAVN
jgi:hypothetical protein